MEKIRSGSAFCIMCSGSMLTVSVYHELKIAGLFSSHLYDMQ